MALSETVLSTAIQTKLAAKNEHLAAAGIDLEYLADAIAEAVVEHVRDFGEVTVVVTSVSGVTAGAVTSGPGSGTGTIS